MEDIIRDKVSKILEKCVKFEKDIFEEKRNVKDENQGILEKYNELLTEFDKEISAEHLGIIVNVEIDSIKKLYIVYFLLDEKIFKKLNADLGDNPGWKAEARIRLYMMYLKVFREVLFLLASGFSDCALARTRTLYEIGVHINIINKNSDILAERFCKHSNVQSMKLSKILSVEKRTKELEQCINQFNFEDGYKKDYGWARILFPNIKDKNVVQFHDLEKLTIYKDYRILYKTACNFVHGSLFSSLESLDSAKERRGREFWNTSPSNEGIKEIIAAIQLYLSLFLKEYADTFNEKTIIEMMLLCFGEDII